VAERVVRSASLPVLLVPSRQAQTTVADAAKPSQTELAAATHELPR
jgi:hypothetical protein